MKLPAKQEKRIQNARKNIEMVKRYLLDEMYHSANPSLTDPHELHELHNAFITVDLAELILMQLLIAPPDQLPSALRSIVAYQMTYWNADLSNYFKEGPPVK